MSIQSDKLLLIETEKLQKSKGTPTTSLFFFAAAESFNTNINHFKVNLRGVVVFCLKIIRYKRKGTIERVQCLMIGWMGDGLKDGVSY